MPGAAPALRVGLVGVGNMGSAMAARLLGLGWPVAVRDIDAQRERDAAALGAAVCATPAELAARSDCAIVCVVDAAQTKTVLFGAGGLMDALGPGAGVLLCPTRPSASRASWPGAASPASTRRCPAALLARATAR